MFLSCTIPVIVAEVFFLQCKNVIELAIFLNIVVVIDKVWSNLAKVLQRVPCSEIDWRYVENQSGLHIDEPLHYDGNGMKWLITEYSWFSCRQVLTWLFFDQAISFFRSFIKTNADLLLHLISSPPHSVVCCGGIAVIPTIPESYLAGLPHKIVDITPVSKRIQLIQ